MIKSFKIAIFFLACLSSVDGTGNQATAATIGHSRAYSTSSQQGARQNRIATPWSARLFAIDQQVEWLLGANSNPEAPAPFNNSTKSGNANSFSKSEIRSSRFCYFTYAKKRAKNLFTKKILFPFHSFL